jgi:hypothetical protein
MVEVDLKTTIGRIKPQRRPFDYLERYSLEKVGHTVISPSNTRARSGVRYKINSYLVRLLELLFTAESYLLPARYRYSDPPCQFFGRHQISYVFMLEALEAGAEPAKVIGEMMGEAFYNEHFTEEIVGAINSGHIIVVDPPVAYDPHHLLSQEVPRSVLVSEEAKRILSLMKK